AAAYRNKKAFDQAIDAYNELLKTDPGSQDAAIGLGLAQLEKGDAALAERTLESAAQSPDASREVFYSLADVKLARSNTDDAVKAYQRAAQADPSWGKPLAALARIAMNKGDREAARKYLQTIV